MLNSNVDVKAGPCVRSCLVCMHVDIGHWRATRYSNMHNLIIFSCNRPIVQLNWTIVSLSSPHSPFSFSFLSAFCNRKNAIWSEEQWKAFPLFASPIDPNFEISFRCVYWTTIWVEEMLCIRINESLGGNLIWKLHCTHEYWANFARSTLKRNGVQSINAKSNMQENQIINF